MLVLRSILLLITSITMCKCGCTLPFFRIFNVAYCSATEYISGTTKNPLVVGTNDTLNSDKRIFASDGNLTMTAYVQMDYTVMLHSQTV
jgi:hypothetical protein